MISKNDYLKNPCNLTSIPYWKYKSTTVPPNIKIVHNNDFRKEKYHDYFDEPYFRLYHNLEEVNIASMKDLEIITCTPDTIGIFVELINKSYTDLCVTLEQLRSYCETPVYCPELWLYLKDKKTGKIIGGGIGDFDRELGEMIIEWVQVLPEYRKCGYGQIIVNSMLAKVKGIAKFATVSGKVKNPTQPEMLYRKCGFVGKDIWHILTKN